MLHDLVLELYKLGIQVKCFELITPVGRRAQNTLHRFYTLTRYFPCLYCCIDNRSRPLRKRMILRHPVGNIIEERPEDTKFYRIVYGPYTLVICLVVHEEPDVIELPL